MANPHLDRGRPWGGQTSTSNNERVQNIKDFWMGSQANTNQVNPYTNISHADNPDYMRNYWRNQGEYERAQMRMNEPEARALEREIAGDFGNKIRTFTPHMEQGFEPGQGGQYGFPGNWPGTPLALGKEQDWNYTITPGDPFDFTQRSGGLDSLIDNDFRLQDIIDSLRTEPGTGRIIPEGPGRDTGKFGEGSYWNVGLWQTWKKILERTGDENLANQWLESQYAV